MDLDFSAEQQAFLDEVRHFADDEVAPRAAAIDESDAFPRDLVARAGAIGLMGVTIPEAWGGRGLDAVAYTLAIEIVSRASATVAVILAVNNSLVVEPLLAQRHRRSSSRWLRPLARGCRGRRVRAVRGHAGTDAANQHTRLTHDGFGFGLIGPKVWVANAAAADLLIVFALPSPTSRAAASARSSCPATPRGSRVGPGRIRSASADSAAWTSTSPTSVSIPMRAARRARQGFRARPLALEGGRVAIAAQALGVGQAALDEALAYAKARHTFGQPIANYQAIQWMLADMATELDAARMLTLRAAAARTTQARVASEAAMAKLFASEAAHRAADKAMQILASAGYRRGSGSNGSSATSGARSCIRGRPRSSE